jgi:hypothetical protein
MSGPPLPPGVPVAFPQPDLATLGASWTETRVLPADPRIPPGTRLYHRRTPDGYLAAVVLRAAQGYQLQVSHRCTATVDETNGDRTAEPTSGRPPTLAELTDAVNRLTAPGLLFMVLLASGAPEAGFPNPMLVTVSQIVVGGGTPLAPEHGRGRRLL